MKEQVYLPMPLSLSSAWNFGFLVGIFSSLQIVTGLVLSMFYSSEMGSAFDSVSYIMRELPLGWILRLLHINGASMIFFLLYLHMSRSLYYRSYLMNKVTWISGVLLYIMMMVIAFLGYTLPMSQMSYWAATVITSMLSVLPFGSDLMQLVWGDFTVNNATLVRFYSLHFILPFVLSVMMLIHMVLLHEKGSSNPLGSRSYAMSVPFQPYYIFQDVLVLFVFFFLFFYLLMMYPFFSFHPENFQSFDPLQTPLHIQPEWYFLFAYAILRSFPSKLGGLLAVLGFLAILFLKPYFTPVKLNSAPKNLIFWCFGAFFILLSWLGSQPLEEPYYSLSMLVTIVTSILLFLVF